MEECNGGGELDGSSTEGMVGSRNPRYVVRGIACHDFEMRVKHCIRRFMPIALIKDSAKFRDYRNMKPSEILFAMLWQVREIVERAPVMLEVLVLLLAYPK